MFEIDLSLQLPEFTIQARIEATGGITVLFGPSGSGKSLTLQCVAGLVRPDEGRIVIGNRVLFDSCVGVNLSAQHRNVGYVPQDFPLFPHLTVAGNVAFGLDGWPRQQAQPAVEEMLDLMGLNGLAMRRPDELSGGQQQRVALARALVRHPEVLLLDEPFAALDAPVRAQLRQQVHELQRRFGLPTLFVTHDLSEASFVADQIAVFERGRVRQVGPPNEVLMRPADLQVARAVGVKNILSGRVIDRTDENLAVQVGGAVFITPLYPFEIGRAVYLCVRPERVLFQRKDRPPGERANRLWGQIVGEVSDGLNCTLFLKTKTPLNSDNAITDLQIDLPVYVYERLDLSQDRTWHVSIPPGAIHVVPAARQESGSRTSR
jgi:molybdate transport system ATP-binding protein